MYACLEREFVPDQFLICGVQCQAIAHMMGLNTDDATFVLHPMTYAPPFFPIIGRCWANEHGFLLSEDPTMRRSEVEPAYLAMNQTFSAYFRYLSLSLFSPSTVCP